MTRLLRWSATDEKIVWLGEENRFPVYYLLQNCSAGFVGNSPVFWKKGDSGYTQWVDDAKWWTKDEAERQIRTTRGSHSWQMWTVEEIRRASRITVDIQELRKLAKASA